METKLNRLLLPVLLFTSGFCGISYEILYGRLLANVIGDQFVVSTAVLLTFLLGIGCGALHAHRLWRWLWLVEAAIGVYAVLFMLNMGAIESLLYRWLPSIGTSIGISLAVAAALLAVPAFAIGVSLPLFAGYFHRLRPSAGYFSASYGIYNLGAALTVIAIEFWLIREVGIRHSVYYIAALNGVVAVGLFLGYRPIAAATDSPTAIDGTGFSRTVVAALALSSVGSAVFQLTALRLAEMLFGPYRESFAYVLCIVLLGIAVGAWLVNRFRIGFVPLMLTNIVGLCWTLAGVYWVMSLFAEAYPNWSGSYWTLVALRFGTLATLTLVPAISFGATIPALLHSQASVGEPANGRDAARSPGYLLYVASLANAAGFLLMALVLHQRLDYGDLLAVVAALSGLSIVILIFSKSRSLAGGKLGLAPALLLVAVFVGLVVTARQQWDEELLYQGHMTFHSPQRMKRRTGPDVSSERYKGANDVIAISRRYGTDFLLINGKISIRLEDASEKIVGAIGGVFAPDHRRALVLGVGSGATAGTVGLLFDQVEAVEISAVILSKLRRLEKYNFSLADMPNVQLVHDDAIHAVRVARDNYSLILNTVTSPLFFSSSKLYTVDFLQEVQQHLAPGGLYMTWLDSRVGETGADIMVQSLTEVFEHCGLAQMSSSYLLLLCSDAPIVAHHPNAAADQPILSAYFQGEHGIDPAGFAYQLLSTNARSLRNPAGAPLNTLDLPVLEFEMTRSAKRSIKPLQQRIEDGLDLNSLGQAFRHIEWSPTAMLLALKSTTGSNRYHLAIKQLGKISQQKRQAASAAQQQGNCDQAVQLLNDALSMTGREGYPNLALGRCHEIQGRHAQALAAYELASPSAPDGQVALVIGRVYLWLENPAAARVAFARIPTAQHNGAYHYMMGKALESLGETDASQAHFDQAVERAGSLDQAIEDALAVTGKPLK